MKETDSPLGRFYRELATFYETSGRHDMLWRFPEEDGSFDPYKILVSELMLQQTQVDRVTPKYSAFLQQFPTVKQLASAPLGAVLKVWSGLGYNRRAKYLWQASQMVETQFGGTFPRFSQELQQLPGVGPNTAGAIMAYAYNQPVVFIETNIRTVIIHHFFQDRSDVGDSEITAVMQTINEELAASRLEQVPAVVREPRTFYWAMMDYGSYLKKTVGNLSRHSTSYSKQSLFAGSLRQVRGEVIRLLAAQDHSLDSLRQLVPDERLDDVLAALRQEQLIVWEGGMLRLA